MKMAAAGTIDTVVVVQVVAVLYVVDRARPGTGIGAGTGVGVGVGVVIIVDVRAVVVVVSAIAGVAMCVIAIVVIVLIYIVGGVNVVTTASLSSSRQQICFRVVNFASSSSLQREHCLFLCVPVVPVRVIGLRCLLPLSSSSCYAVFFVVVERIMVSFGLSTPK